MTATVPCDSRRCEKLLARILVAGVALLAAPPALAGELCAADPPIAPGATTDATLVAAGALGSPLDRPRARALYLAVLARDPADEEAAVGLADVDAADGCVALAEPGYRAVLARSPGNVAAGAALADLLVRDGRLGAAAHVLDAALFHEPFAPELLSRRARVASFAGEPAKARAYYALAERVVPLDPEVQVAKDRVVLGQARIGQRIQLFPSGYDDLYTTDASAMLRTGRLRWEAGATVMRRSGALRATRSGLVPETILDGRPSLGAYWHLPNGAFAGGSVAISAPALALPRYAVGLAAFTPLRHGLAVHGAVAYWRYRDERDVIILSPAVSYALGESVDVTARYWATTVLVPGAGTSGTAHSFGGRIGWRPHPRLSLGVDYTYGVQLERNPTATELLDLRSHIVSLLGLVLLDRSFGLDAALSVERRVGPDIWGPAAEVGAFVRW